MKKSYPTVLPWRRLPYGIAIFSFLLAVGVLIAFLCIAPGLPDTVPVHWSELGGFDKWGAKTELYPLAFIPPMFGLISLLCSIVAIRREINGIAYFASGISLFVTCLMALVMAFMVNAAGV